MTLDFRIDWGYQYLYSRRHYHPQYIWDGSLDCENGEIKEIYSLDYPVIWFRPGPEKDEQSFDITDLSDICGIRVIGRGVEYCGRFNCKNRESIPVPELSAMPSDSTEETKAARCSGLYGSLRKKLVEVTYEDGKFNTSVHSL